MRRPRRIACDDGGEVVVEQDEAGRLARHVGAAPAHGDADVRGLERGRVVDAVAGHRHDLAARLQRPHDPQLLLGHDAREDVDVANAARRSPASSSALELGARSTTSSGVAEADLAGDARAVRG